MSQQYSRWQDFQRAPMEARNEQLEELRQRVHQFVIEQVGPMLMDENIQEHELRRLVHEHVHKSLTDEGIALSASERAQLIQDVTDDTIGYGPIDRFLQDPGITEVMVNGPKNIYIERRGRIEPTDVEFVDEKHLRRTIDKIVGAVGRRIDESTPMVDARLPDGSRVNAVVHPVAMGGPFLTIRKFSKDPYTVGDLIAFGTLTPQVAHFLDACVRGRLNTVISGGTGTGKTTMLNVVSSFIPNDERIVTVEDAKELRLLQEHVCSMESRPPNIEGSGEVRIRDLVRNSLRMRPDRIIVGEARGAEALDMLQAMNTGHDGSLTTIHANSPRDTLSRVETMTLMAGMDLPIRAVREQMASALDMVIHLSRMRDGSRRITSVSEVLGMEGDTIIMQDLYVFDFGMGVDEDGRFLGRLKSTGIRPHFSERLSDHGINLEPELFTLEPFARRVVGSAMNAALTLAADFIGGEGSQWAIVLATVLGTAALVASVGVLLGRREATVQRRLAGYELPDQTEVGGGGMGQPETAIVQQGVDLASRLAGRTSLLEKTERMLEQADVPVRPGELLFYTPLAAVLVFLFLSILFGWIAGLVAGALVVAGVFAYFARKRGSRLHEFERMLPPTLTLLASSMRAGFSLMQSLETVTQEAPEVVRREFQRVFTEVRLGRPVEDALQDIADRMDSRDLQWTVMAIRIQREVGGNLAALLDTIADTMTKREALRREVRTLTAEGRLSGIVLSLFPIGMFILLYVVRPSYMETLLEDPVGITALIVAGVANVIGWFMIRKIVDIEA